ncbi:MAG: pentapeptide repeat-containing protein, partial [Cyanobacteria bacterium J06632_19]
DKKLSNANLKNANFSNANLQGTNLSQAQLWGANFSSANLKSTNFKGADIKNSNFFLVENLTPQQIKAALNWREAKYDLDFRFQLGLV